MIRSEPLKKGAIIDGFVTRITNFGAFVDLDGVDGLLHISQISWQRIRHPAGILTIGQRVKVVVLKIDSSKKRISLGRKQLLNRKTDQTPEHQRRVNFKSWRKKQKVRCGSSMQRSGYSDRASTLALFEAGCRL